MFVLFRVKIKNLSQTRCYYRETVCVVFKILCFTVLVLLSIVHHKIRSKQGWARDVKGRDRDAHVSRPRQDQDVGFTSRD